MHKDVMTAAVSKQLGDVVKDMERWESELGDYYKCGGEALPEKTEVLIAMAPTAVKSQLRSLATYDFHERRIEGHNQIP